MPKSETNTRDYATALRAAASMTLAADHAALLLGAAEVIDRLRIALQAVRDYLDTPYNEADTNPPIEMIDEALGKPKAHPAADYCANR